MNAYSVLIRITKIELCRRIPLFCRLEIPIHGFNTVLGSATSEVVGIAKI